MGMKPLEIIHNDGRYEDDMKGNVTLAALDTTIGHYHRFDSRDPQGRLDDNSQA